MMPVLIAAAPMAGGFINESYGFRGCFIALTLIVLISLLTTLTHFTETLPPQQRKAFRLERTFHEYRTVGSSKAFWQLVLMPCLLSSGYLMFISQIALLFMIELRVSSRVFPWYQGLLLSTYFIGTLAGGPLVKAMGLDLSKKCGIALTISGVFFLAAVCIMSPNDPFSIATAIVPFILGYVWLQMIYFSELLQLFPSHNGTVSSLRTSSRVFITALVLEAAGRLYNQSIKPVWVIEFVIVLTVALIMNSYEEQANSRAVQLN